MHGVHLPAGFSAADVTPALLAHLPAAIHQGFVAGYAESIQTVFLVAVPIAALAFLATWLIPQVELKKWPEAVQPATEQAATEQAVTGQLAAGQLATEQVVTGQRVNGQLDAGAVPTRQGG